MDYKNITTFKDACKALGISTRVPKYYPAFYKLQTVLKAVNGNHEWQFNEGNIYYPCVNIYTFPTKLANYKVNLEGKLYFLVGGLGCLNSVGLSAADSDAGFLSCKSYEVAQHVSTYFTDILFDAIIGFKLKDYKIEKIK